MPELSLLQKRLMAQDRARAREDLLQGAILGENGMTIKCVISGHPGAAPLFTSRAEGNDNAVQMFAVIHKLLEAGIPAIVNANWYTMVVKWDLANDKIKIVVNYEDGGHSGTILPTKEDLPDFL